MDASPLLRFSPRDNVGAATRPLRAGERVPFEGERLRLVDDVPLGHKVALMDIAAGDRVLKYGAPIGTASAVIPPGAHVHLHNLRSDYMPPAGRPEVMA